MNKRLEEWVRKHKIPMEYFRLGVLSLAVSLYIALGVFCLNNEFADAAMGYFLSPFIAGQLVFIRHAWLPVGVVRAYDDLIQRYTPPLLLDPTTIRSLIFAALSFLYLVFHVLARYLTSILSYYRNRLVEESIRHQLLLVTNLSPRSPPVFL